MLAMLTAAAPIDSSVPFVPSPPEVVEGMLDLAGLKAGERLVDLGSGDGRVAIAAARRGASALGVDISAGLVARARLHARDEGVEGKARFVRGDLFTATIRDADVVTLYLLPDVNRRVRPKLLTELRAGTRVVSHAFDMSEWAPDARRLAAGRMIYLWIVPAVVGGRWQLTYADGRTAVLELGQRFQQVTGTLDGQPLSDVVLQGNRLRFTVREQALHALVTERTMVPDPAAPSQATKNWRGERAE